jgi:hypothetical protein
VNEPSRFPLHLRLYLAGALIFIAGLVAATLIYRNANDADERAYAAMDNAQYEYQLERLGGKAMVMVAQFNHWLSSLWHGQRLAYTVAAIAFAAALTCVMAGEKMAEQADRRAERAREREEATAQDDDDTVPWGKQ